MRVADVVALDATFQVHAHVIAREGDEHRVLLGFRDSLRRDPKLRRAYEEDKERILASGLADAVEYSKAKGSFIDGVLSRIARP